ALHGDLELDALPDLANMLARRGTLGALTPLDLATERPRVRRDRAREDPGVLGLDRFLARDECQVALVVGQAVLGCTSRVAERPRPRQRRRRALAVPVCRTVPLDVALPFAARVAGAPRRGLQVQRDVRGRPRSVDPVTRRATRQPPIQADYRGDPREE